jgi:hypothetical protein
VHSCTEVNYIGVVRGWRAFLNLVGEQVKAVENIIINLYDNIPWLIERECDGIALDFGRDVI